jgi:hypothetical protein
MALVSEPDSESAHCHFSHPYFFRFWMVLSQQSPRSGKGSVEFRVQLKRASVLAEGVKELRGQCKRTVIYVDVSMWSQE